MVPKFRLYYYLSKFCKNFVRAYELKENARVYRKRNENFGFVCRVFNLRREFIELCM